MWCLVMEMQVIINMPVFCYQTWEKCKSQYPFRVFTFVFLHDVFRQLKRSKKSGFVGTSSQVKLMMEKRVTWNQKTNDRDIWTLSAHTFLSNTERVKEKLDLIPLLTFVAYRQALAGCVVYDGLDLLKGCKTTDDHQKIKQIICLFPQKLIFVSSLLFIVVEVVLSLLNYLVGVA